MQHPETALVTILMGLGMRHRRAVSIERWLDDERPCGLSGDVLAGLFDGYHKSRRHDEELERATAEQLMLTYGTTDLDAVREGRV